MPGLGSRAVPKVPPGRLSLRAERELKRLQRLKGKKGVTAAKRVAKSRKTQLAERAVKSDATRLDGWRCRWPECDVPKASTWGRLHAAHFQAEGMGGDPTLQRCTLDNLIGLCHWHHRGPRGIDQSGLARMEPLNPTLGTRGPVAFYLKDRETGRETLVGITEPPPPETLSTDNEG
jgi:hypothetical protein